MAIISQKNLPLRVLYIVGYYLLSAATLLGLVEVVVRTAYPEISPTATSHDFQVDSMYGTSAGLRPMASGVSGEKMFSVDAHGFWKYSQPDSPRAGWLILGDSGTMGIGVEPDSTFAGRLSLLCPDWYILNPSWIGYSSADYVNIIRELLLKHRAFNSTIPFIRRVTIFWTLNDVYSDCFVGMPPGQAVREQASGILSWLRQHYRTYHWLKSMFLDRPKAYYEFDAQFYQPDDPRFIAASRDLEDVKHLCANAGVQLQVVLLPYEYQLRLSRSVTNRPQSLLSQKLDSLNVPWYDFASTFRDLPGSYKNLYLFGDGIHFSDRGHSKISLYVLEAICSPSR